MTVEVGRGEGWKLGFGGFEEFELRVKLEGF
jgi:hypothetical protein